MRYIDLKTKIFERKKKEKEHKVHGAIFFQYFAILKWMKCVLLCFCFGWLNLSQQKS